jgi:hypothetical protein
MSSDKNDVKKVVEAVTDKVVPVDPAKLDPNRVVHRINCRVEGRKAPCKGVEAELVFREAVKNSLGIYEGYLVRYRCLTCGGHFGIRA